MAILIVLLALLAATAIVAAIRAVATDGYRRAPFLSRHESTWSWR